METEKDSSNIDYKRINALSHEFTQHWKRVQAMYLDAIAGFLLVRQSVEKEQSEARKLVEGSELDSEDFQNTRQFTYARIFSEDVCTSGIHQATQGEVKLRNSPTGQNFTMLGQLCVVSFADYWNDHLRPQYCIAIGKLNPGMKYSDKDKKEILRKHASVDIWGDLGLIRNAIVHNQGIATANMSRCKLIRWYKHGEEIVLPPARMRAIFLALLKYRNDLNAQQYPPRTLRIHIPKVK